MADTHDNEANLEKLEAASNRPDDDAAADHELAAAAKAEAMQQAMDAQDMMMGDEPFDVTDFPDESESAARDDDEPLPPIETADVSDAQNTAPAGGDAGGDDASNTAQSEGATQPKTSVQLEGVTSVKTANPNTPDTRVPSLSATPESVDKHVFSAPEAVAGKAGEKQPAPERVTASGRDLSNKASVADLHRQAVKMGLITADEKLEFAETMEYLSQQTAPTRESVLAGTHLSQVMEQFGYATGPLSSQAYREKNLEQQAQEEQLRELAQLEDKLVSYLHHWQNKAAREQVRAVLVEIDAQESNRSDEHAVTQWLGDQVTVMGLEDVEDELAEALSEAPAEADTPAMHDDAAASDRSEVYEDVQPQFQAEPQVEAEPQAVPERKVASVSAPATGDTAADTAPDTAAHEAFSHRRASVADGVALWEEFTHTQRSIFMRRINAVPLDELEAAYADLGEQVEALTAENARLRREVDRLSD